MTKILKLKRLNSSIFADYRKKTEGSTSMMFAASLSALLMGIAATIDVSTSLAAKSKMQTALDSAVLSAAINADADNFIAFAEEAYHANLSVEGISNTTLTFTKETNATAQTVTGTVRAKTPLLFSEVFNKDGLDVSLSSVAKVDISTVADVPTGEGPTCVMSLSTNDWHALTINSGAKLNAPGCEVHVHSEKSSAMAVNGGIDVDVHRTCVAGSGITDNSQGQIGRVDLNCDVRPDPYAGLVPEPTDVSCDYSHGNYDSAPGNKLVMQPGTYCGWHNFNNSNIDVEFAPGLYVIRNGGWNVNGGNWSGQGVTFYLYDNSNLQFNSNVKADFSAPTTGDYKDVFLTERPSLNSIRNYTMNSNSGFNFDGAVYLPRSNFTMNSGGDLVIRRMQFVANRVMLNGSIGFDVENLPPYIPADGGTVTTSTVEMKTTPYLAK